MPGWFDEQLRARIKADNDIFANAFSEISEVILGKKLINEIQENELANADNAIEEIMRFYKIPVQENNSFFHSKNKTLDEELESRFRTSGIMRREIELNENWYHDSIGAYLGMTNDGHYIALIPDRFWGYTYKDHSTGEKIKLNKKTQDNISNHAICFYKPLPEHKLTIRDLISYMLNCLSFRDFFEIIAVTLIITLISMITPVLTKYIYSQVIFSDNSASINSIFIFLAGVSVSTILFEISRDLILTRISIKTDINVRAAVMMRLINLPADFFKKFSSGELAQRASYINLLCSVITNNIFSVFLTAVISMIYLYQIFSFAVSLIFPALLIMFVLIIFSLITIRLESHEIKHKMNYSAKENGLIYAFITGIQKIKLTGSEQRAFGKWASIYKHNAKLEYNPPLFLKINSALRLIITFSGTFLIYWRAFHSGIDVNNYMAFMAVYSLFSGAFINLCEGAVSASTIIPILELVSPILEAEPEISENKKIISRLSGNIEINEPHFGPDFNIPQPYYDYQNNNMEYNDDIGFNSIKGNIEINDITFGYNDNDSVLENLSLKIKSGQYIAVTGKSGCGKSTLMRLLLGFESPQKGVIFYDGKDIKTLDLKSLRSHIGCVLQNSRLFSGSIYENITISAPNLSENEVWEAAEMAGIADDIKKMPMGMNTIISEGAGTISGGQKQRIIIARAIAPKPKILFFDEATSALDNITQNLVSQSLDNLKCTRIIIAHRLSTIKHCDRIVLIDNGKIIEDGNYEQLINKKGIFYELVERQQIK